MNMVYRGFRELPAVIMRGSSVDPGQIEETKKMAGYQSYLDSHPVHVGCCEPLNLDDLNIRRTSAIPQEVRNRIYEMNKDVRA